MVESTQQMQQKKKSRQCQYMNCGTRGTFYLLETPKLLYCKTHKSYQMITSPPNKCEGQDCTKQGTFKVDSLQYCSLHKPEDAVSSRTDLCKFQDCKIRATYNIKGQKKGQFCQSHKSADMVDVTNKLCTYLNCQTRSKPNNQFCEVHTYKEAIQDYIKNQLINILIDKCIEQSEQIPLKNKSLCQTINCDKRGTYGLIDQIGPKEPMKCSFANNKVKRTKDGCRLLYCKEHKTDQMEDLVHPRCQFEDCQTRAGFNYPDDKTPTNCSEHMLPGMLDIRRYSNKCKHENCNIRASFGLQQDRIRQYCGTHKQDQMIQLENVSCIQEGCNVRAHFNIQGQTKGLYCYHHKKQNMINIQDRQCLNCNIVARYGQLCSRCYYLENPDNTQTRLFKIKQKAVDEFIKLNIQSGEINGNVYFDQIIQGGTSKYRPDILIDIGTHCLIIETNEFQHRTYDINKEEQRMNQIYIDLKSRPLVIIKFNPDGYYQKHIKIASPWSYKDKNTTVLSNKQEWNERLTSLIDVINKYSNIIPQEQIQYISMYMDVLQ